MNRSKSKIVSDVASRKNDDGLAKFSLDIVFRRVFVLRLVCRYVERLNRSIERIELFSLVLRRRAQNEYESPTEISKTIEIEIEVFIEFFFSFREN